MKSDPNASTTSSTLMILDIKQPVYKTKYYVHLVDSTNQKHQPMLANAFQAKLWTVNNKYFCSRDDRKRRLQVNIII